MEGGQGRAEETSWATCSLSARPVMGTQGLGTGVPQTVGPTSSPCRAVGPQPSELPRLNLGSSSLNEGAETSPTDFTGGCRG